VHSPPMGGHRKGDPIRSVRHTDVTMPLPPFPGAYAPFSPSSGGDALAATRDAVREFEPSSLAVLIGGLQLLPANIHFAWRIQALAALTMGYDGAATIRPARRADLAPLLHRGVLADVADMQEDPYDDVVAEELAFHEGSFLLGSGLAENAVSILRRAVRATLVTDLPPREPRNELLRTASAALHLSDHVLRAAGIARNTPPPEAPDRVVIPGAATLNRLGAVVTFTPEQLQEATNTLNTEALEPLMAAPGAQDATTADIHEGTPGRWPLLRDGDTTILVKPLDLALALRHHLVHSAVEAVGAEAVAAAFGAVADHDARDALNHLGPQLIRDDFARRTPERSWTGFVVDIDAGLQMRCLVVADGFTATDAGNPHAGWDRDATLQEAVDALEQTAATTDDDILGVVIAAAAGGSVMMGISDPEHANLRTKMLGLEDLETICFLETGDPLALYKFVRASDAITGRVLSFGPLDLYGMYLDQDRSFGPQSGATFVNVLPGWGLRPRTRYKAQRDLHGVRYTDGTVREVRRVEPDNDDGFLYELYDIVGRRLVHVAGLPMPVWVGGPVDAVHETWSLVNSVAFWLSELGGPLFALSEQLGGLLPCLAIEAGDGAGGPVAVHGRRPERHRAVR
jgi:hypothetical protein